MPFAIGRPLTMAVALLVWPAWRQSRKVLCGYISVRVVLRWLLILGVGVVILEQTRKEVTLDALDAPAAE